MAVEKQKIEQRSECGQWRLPNIARKAAWVSPYGKSTVLVSGDSQKYSSSASYQVCLQFRQVTMTLFFPLAPHNSPKGPTNK